MINQKNKKESLHESLFSFNISLGLKFIGIAIIGLIFLLFPVFFDSYTLEKLGTIGDFFGGIMNPFIAIAAAFLTFLAFYVQYQANEDVRKQFKIQQFENQFFEMLRLHKENVNEMNINGYSKSVEITREYNENNREKIKLIRTERSVDKFITGRKVFVSMVNELIFCCDFCIEMNKQNTKKYRKEDLLKLGYMIFFNGSNSDLLNTKNCNGVFVKKVQDKLKEIRKLHKESKGDYNLHEINNKKLELNIKYSPFTGHVSRLGHYYRHLFYMVVYVVENEKKELFGYNKSRDYLKLLRAQLSNDEQLLLFYNYKIGFGEEWETNENKFFSKYRMLHNLPTRKVKYYNPINIFKNEIEQIRIETDGKKTMFEWGDK